MGDPRLELSDSADAETIAAQSERPQREDASPDPIDVQTRAAATPSRAAREEDPHLTRPPSGAVDLSDPHLTRPPSSAKVRRPTPPGAPSPDTDWRAHELVGRGFGPWRVEGLLGEGGWGAVFRARHEDDPERKAALKIPKLDDPITRDERLARFKIEIECIQRIHAAGASTHVVELLGADPDAELPWLALELIEGTDLSRQLNRRRKFPLREGLALGMGTLQGLIEAHRAGVVHRDLKPANVLKTYAGEVRLTDFGVARQVRHDETSVHVAGFGLTTTGQQIGSVHSMSPEAIDGKTVEAPGDLYSFGCLLYHLLAGRPPFRGGLVQIYHAHLSQKPAPLSDFAVGIPPALDALVERLLAKEPAARPTASDAQEELKRILAALELQESEATPAGSSSSITLELRPGDEVDDERSSARYTILHELGRGGMGIVYAAEASTGERYALKVAGHGFANHEQARQQLIRDAENAIRVSSNGAHPAVAKVYSVGTAVVRKTPIVFLVSELVEGPSLADVIRDSGPLDDRIGLRLLTHVAKGIGAIHEAGLIHLDVTPGNILLSDLDADDLHAGLGEANPKIVDFGISRDVHSTTDRGVEGNPLYMSPEQCEGQAATFASDIYMLGAAFYHATTGRPPFSGEAIAVMSQHRTAAPRFADLESALGHDLALVLHKCLFKDPDDRYSSATQLLADLHRVGSAGFPRGELKAAWAREHKRLAVSRRLTTWGPSIVAVVALAVIAVVSWVAVDRSQVQAQVKGDFGPTRMAIEGEATRSGAALEERYSEITELRAKYPELTEEDGFQDLVPVLARKGVKLLRSRQQELWTNCSQLDAESEDLARTELTRRQIKALEAEVGAIAKAFEIQEVNDAAGTEDDALLATLGGEIAHALRLCDLTQKIQQRRWAQAEAIRLANPAGGLASVTAKLRGVLARRLAAFAADWARLQREVNEHLDAARRDEANDQLKRFKAEFATKDLESFDWLRPRQQEPVWAGLVRRAKTSGDVLAAKDELQLLRDRLQALGFYALQPKQPPEPKEQEGLVQALKEIRSYQERHKKAPEQTKGVEDLEQKQARTLWASWAQLHLREAGKALAEYRAGRGDAALELAHSEALDAATYLTQDLDAVDGQLAGKITLARAQTLELLELRKELIEVQPGLRVDACETRVRTYEVFLRTVAALDAGVPGAHRGLLGCKEPTASDHTPRSWVGQRAFPERPVRGISWYDADACARWAGRRLLTVDEWKLAAVGSSPEPNSQRRNEWLKGALGSGWNPFDDRPLEVREGESRGGIWNMAGNVSEWTDTPTSWGGHYFAGPSFQDFRNPETPLSIHVLAPKGFRYETDDAKARVDVGLRGALR